VPLPEPLRCRREPAWGIVVAGVGGTGVITIGQLLGMAAHLEGKGVVTQDAAGLAQKGGATWSHVQIADARTTSAPPGGHGQGRPGDRLRPIVAAGKETLLRMREAAPMWRSTRTARPPPPSCATRLAEPGRGLRGPDRARRRRRPGRFDAETLATAAGRQHLRQPHDAGLRLAKGWCRWPGLADARHRAQRRGGRQQGRLRMGPPAPTTWRPCARCCSRRR
jgi:indolepyruvate ferredoxin oxidoreductase